MDRLSLIGLLLSLAAILGGQMLEGGKVTSLIQGTAFLIVIGGTLGAVLLQSQLTSFVLGMRMLKWIAFSPQIEMEAWARTVVNWSNVARRGGLLALENPLMAEKDPFVKRALQLLVDGAEPEAIRHAMDLEIGSYEEKHRAAARIWDSAGGYSPTIGILGAVMGLIHVMENLTEPSKLGSGIAVAFVATIYGVGFANLFFLPIGNKLKQLIAAEIRRRDMVTEGLIGIAQGENPRIIENKVRGFLA
ncbi:flagellar motor protein [Chitinimonas sp. BJB300]|uniref:flagellar motor protein n=1 Tax=Chitinimonas sp. BJB300 TaxID=1559339 RepID=UPI000C0DB7D8|nr:flagellar motor protein [Chitinimonas sp. BJB300]PHV11551.1 flagellar motor protein [Chitinimonas sp. BJB300]TSJ87259.1 flagellar motor protein [Chitinimonas sp. BJB300]